MSQNFNTLMKKTKMELVQMILDLHNKYENAKTSINDSYKKCVENEDACKDAQILIDQCKKRITEQEVKMSRLIAKGEEQDQLIEKYTKEIDELTKDRKEAYDTIDDLCNTITTLKEDNQQLLEKLGMTPDPTADVNKVESLQYLHQRLSDLEKSQEELAKRVETHDQVNVKVAKALQLIDGIMKEHEETINHNVDEVVAILHEMAIVNSLELPEILFEDEIDEDVEEYPYPNYTPMTDDEITASKEKIQSKHKLETGFDNDPMKYIYIPLLTSLTAVLDYLKNERGV